MQPDPVGQSDQKGLEATRRATLKSFSCRVPRWIKLILPGARRDYDHVGAA
jgi:hypothetical protein